MELDLTIYRNATFDGCIYVKINSRADINSAIVQLFKDGAVVASKEAQQKFVRFKNNEPGLYQSVAILTRNNGAQVRIASSELSITEQAVDAKTMHFPPAQNVKGTHGFCDNVEHHYLELKLEKGCLERLNAENPAVVSRFHGLKNRLAISKISLKAFWEDDEDEENCDRCTIKSDMSNAEMLALAQELEQLDYVIYCCITPSTYDVESSPDMPDELTPEELSEQNSPESSSTTPSFRHLQTYLNPGAGMNVHAAWQTGERGERATVRVIDASVFQHHENLIINENITIVTNNSENDPDADHGTATTGCIAAQDTFFGVIGIAHRCNFFFYDRDYATGSINLVVRDAVPGDIVSLSLGQGFNGRRVPLTHTLFWWERIHILANRGVTVILAAANSGINLSLASGNMNQYGDSGSMLAGACDRNTGRRLNFSNHSHPTSLINSWGHGVTTTGYGNLQRINNNRNYTNYYNGTSAAAPLCSGVLALIQSSYIKAGTFMAPAAMRSIIQTTGSAQGLNDGIGRRPNARLALWNDNNNNNNGFLLINTQAQMDQIGQPGNLGTRVMIDMLRTNLGLEIVARDNVWTSELLFPSSSLVERGRVISITTQATLPITLWLGGPHQVVMNRGDSARFVAEGSSWRRENNNNNGFLLINTQAQMNQIGAGAQGAVVMTEQLRTHQGLDILAQDGVWTSHISLPHPANVARDRVISFATQASWPTTISFGGTMPGTIVFNRGNSARFVTDGSAWRRS